MTKGLAVLLVLVATIAAACSSQIEDAGDTAIPVQDAGLVAQGEVAYQASCAECHGSDLRGTERGPSHLSIVYEPNHHGDAAFLLAAQRGVQQHHWPYGDMEPIPSLSSEELEAIIAYVREQQRIEGFEPYPPES